MDGKDKILINKTLLEEVCGALVATSMSNNGIEYLDNLVSQLEKCLEENE